MGGIGPVQLIIVLVIVIAIFGTKKLANLGTDLGSAIKGFKNAVKEEEKPTEKLTHQNTDEHIIEGGLQREKDKTQ